MLSLPRFVSIPLCQSNFLLFFKESFWINGNKHFKYRGNCQVYLAICRLRKESESELTFNKHCLTRYKCRWKQHLWQWEEGFIQIHIITQEPPTNHHYCLCCHLYPSQGLPPYLILQGISYLCLLSTYHFKTSVAHTHWSMSTCMMLVWILNVSQSLMC